MSLQYRFQEGNFYDLCVCKKVGKYIGRGRIQDAKRAAVVGVGIGMAIVTIIGMIFIFGRHLLPRIYTDNEETIDLTAQMMYIMTAYCAGCVVLQTIGGIYRYVPSKPLIQFIPC